MSKKILTNEWLDAIIEQKRPYVKDEVIEWFKKFRCEGAIDVN